MSMLTANKTLQSTLPEATSQGRLVPQSTHHTSINTGLLSAPFSGMLFFRRLLDKQTTEQKVLQLNS